VNLAPLLEQAPRLRLRGRVWRLVESQEQVATNELVDSLEEQALLEELLETTKPRRAPGTEKLHYLLATPFRYPPLRWGSRFGRAWEPALFYASNESDTALTEAAYYRLLFWSGMARAPRSGRFTSQHTLFAVPIDTRSGLRLQAPPFDAIDDELRHPSRYDTTQALGTQMREAGIEAFEYRSARRRDDEALNTALFVPGALSARTPDAQQPWLCETRMASVVFAGEGRTLRFELERFLIDGQLPQPA
jgi:hypothetical protein